MTREDARPSEKKDLWFGFMDDGDIPDVADLAWLAKCPIWQEKKIKALKDKESLDSLVVEHQYGSGALAFAIYRRRTKGYKGNNYALTIQLFAVDPEVQAAGVGEKLRDHLWEHARERGFHSMYVGVPEDDLATQEYMTRLGFYIARDDSGKILKIRQGDQLCYQMAYWGPEVQESIK